MQINLYIILGIWAFFLIEKVTHQYFESHDHSHGQHEHKKQSAVSPETVEE